MNLQESPYTKSEKQLIVKENTVYVNREKMFIQQQTSKDSSDSTTIPLISDNNDLVSTLTTTTATYNTLR